MSNLNLIIGGARSGKSKLAEDSASDTKKDVIFIATLNSSLSFQFNDVETIDRISKHQQSRPKTWHTFEITTNIAQFLIQSKFKNKTILIDCLSLYVSNLILANETLEYQQIEDIVLNDIKSLLIQINKEPSNTFIIVTNEVGLSLVPNEKLGRYFRDILGHANKLVAESADSVILTVCGLQLKLK